MASLEATILARDEEVSKLGQRLRELQQAGVRAVTEGEGAEMLAALVHALRLDEEEASEAEGARRRPGPLCAVPARLFAALRSRL